MKLTLLLTCFAIACNTAEPAPTLSSGARSLGIATLDVNDSADRLSIRGLDADGATVAQLDLAVGPFLMTLDDQPRQVVGRQLTVEVLGKTAKHESEGLATLQLPLHEITMKAFMLDPQVASALAQHGVSFDENTPLQVAPGTDLTEQAYSCDSTNSYPLSYNVNNDGFGGCSSSFTTATVLFNGEWNPLVGEYRCCGGSAPSANERRCSYDGQGQPTNCGSTGPQGCAVCWSYPGVTSCSTGVVRTIGTGDVGLIDAAQVSACGNGFGFPH
jgi:hypothetical protein